MTLIKKAIPYILVIISLLAAFLVFQRVNPEWLFKQDGPPVTLTQISKNIAAHYAGQTAGADIPRLTGSQEFDTILDTQYVTAEPSKVIATGIYGLKPWVDSHARTTGGSWRHTRKTPLPEVTSIYMESPGDYLEYYLIQLPDGTYIPAQFSDTYRRDIDRGKKITLPIGVKKGNGNLTKSYLGKICEQYDASPASTLYMVDDTWYQEHDFTFFLIKLGVAAVVFFVAAILLFLVEARVKNAITKKTA